MKHIKKFNEEMDANREPIDWAHLNGEELQREYMRIWNDPAAVKKAFEDGLDPNFDNLIGVRHACKGTWTSRENPGESYFEVYKMFAENGARLNVAGGPAIKWAAEYGRFDILEHLVERAGVTTGFQNAIHWLNHSRKIDEDTKARVIAYLREKIEEYGVQ